MNTLEKPNNYPKRYRIPFYERVLELSKKNVSLSVGLNKTEQAVLELLIEASNSTADTMAKKVGLSTRTIERALSNFQKKRKIERVGSRGDGSWVVIR